MTRMPTTPWGAAARSLRAVLLMTLCGMTVAGCSNSNGQQNPAPGGASRPGDGEGRPETPAVPVGIHSVGLGSIASTYAATATLEAEAEAQVLARVAGVVEIIEVEEGSGVGAGQTLLRIDNDEYRLRVEQAAATTANLRAKFDRMERMREQSLASAEEFDTAKNDLATAEADEELARLSLSYTTVAAPFAGKVTQRLVDPGQNVSAGTPLFVLADLNPLLARIHIPSKEFRKLRTEEPVTLALDSTGERLQGMIKLVSPIIDPNTGTIKVTVEIDEYPPTTRPGDFAQVELVTDRHSDRVLVPRSAVISDKGDDVVFVDQDGQAERRVVEIGFTDERFAEVASGVQAGERVVVKGQRSLKHGTPLKVLEVDGRPVEPAESSTAEAGARQPQAR